MLEYQSKKFYHFNRLSQKHLYTLHFFWKIFALFIIKKNILDGFLSYHFCKLIYDFLYEGDKFTLS